MVDSAQQKVDLTVIGAALPRTGTLSLKIALEKLGFGKCYHMLEVIENDHSKTWQEIYEGKHKNFSKVLSGYHSTVDCPGSHYWEELSKLNPDAKVILTVRDSPEAWFKSCDETVVNTIYPQRRPFGLILNSFFFGRVKRFLEFHNAIHKTYPKNINVEEFTKFYNDYISEVKSKVPEDKLLVFNVKQGWEPLCKFLNVPVPNEEFPRVNDTKEFKDRIVLLTRIGYFAIFLGIGAFTSAGYYLMKKYVRK